MQTTVRTTTRYAGTGLHGGRPARMAIRPAPADHGIRFRRTDLRGADAEVPANWRAVVPARLCTRVANAAGTQVGTIEHLMAALAGCGIHNALIEIDGPEVPILDGSAAPFVAKLVAGGIERLDAPLRLLRVTRPVEVRHGDAVARLEPARGFGMTFEIDFEDAAIGHQALSLDLANGAIVRALSDSRTFCRLRDIEALRGDGLVRGGSLHNAVVVDGAAVLSPGGLRHPDEAVRHKMLDAVGDLALAGAPIEGRYVGRRAGHELTARLLRAAFAERAVTPVICDPERADLLPGAGVCRADLPLSA